MSGFIFNPPTEIEVYQREIGPRPTAIVLQGSDSQKRSRSKSPGASLRRKDTLKRQYSTSAVRRRSQQHSHVASSTQAQHPEPSASGTAEIRHRHSLRRTSSPGPFLERGRHHNHQEAQEPVEGTQEYVTAHRANFPTPFLSAATFHKAGVDEVERSRNLHKARLARRAYLRHSFNRMDFIAVVSYWIALILELTGVMNAHHIYVFQMLSCLRIFRLLGITEGTSVSCFESQTDYSDDITIFKEGGSPPGSSCVLCAVLLGHLRYYWHSDVQRVVPTAMCVHR